MLLTAKQAREKSDASILQKEEKTIEALITDAIEKGEYSCYLDFSISQVTKELLESLGYTIKRGSYRDEDTTEVSW